MEKVCTCCGKLKPLTEYYKKTSTKDGFAAHCADCGRAKRKLVSPFC